MDEFKVFILLMSVAAAITAAAQESRDTVAGGELHEIVVQAPRVVQKADMDVYYPPASAVASATDGMRLLRNLMIPTLSVNDAMGTITASGQAVEVRINGRVASIDQVKSLLPSTIRRVEWIDNPGLRYNGANYVLNFIVSNPTVGGSLMLHAKPVLTEKWGYYQEDAKFNIGRSQWSVGGYFKLTDGIEAYRDYKETFTYPDGTTLTRNEKPVGGSIDNTQGAANIPYSYIRPDTTVFYASVRVSGNLSNKTMYDGLLSLGGSDGDIGLNDTRGDRGATPSVTAYLERHLSGNQTIVADFGASFYDGHTFSDYVESIPGTPERVADIHTYIKDRNQAYAVEVDYIKKWRRSRLTAGASYKAARNRSEYRNLGGEVFHQRQDNAYFFAEYYRRINKVAVTAGIGMQYTSLLFRETRQGRDSWGLRPQATVVYSVRPGHQLRLSFTSWQSVPSLAETNIAPVQTDGFQWRVGNPDLRVATSYKLSFRYGFNCQRLDGALGVHAVTRPDAVAPYLYWEGDRLVTTYENSRGMQSVALWAAPQVKIIPGWFTVSGRIQYKAERMRGTGYRHRNHGWSGEVSALVSHWGFDLGVNYIKAERNLWGEGISWGEDVSIVDLTYVRKSWAFSAGVIMPFGKYDQGSRSLSRWNMNESHMRIDMCMPYVAVSYNLQWGRQKKGAGKLINVDSGVEQSKAGGR